LLLTNNLAIEFWRWYKRINFTAQNRCW